jgi:hypothetical protein
VSDQYYLVCGTMQELRQIVRERNIDFDSIRLIQRPEDIYGRHGGKIILGVTGYYKPFEFDQIINYARRHNIEVP